MAAAGSFSSGQGRLFWMSILFFLLYAGASISVCSGASTGQVSSSEERRFTVVSESFRSPKWKKRFYLFRPDYDSIFPLLLFCPAFNAPLPGDYEELIRHLAGNGHSVLYMPARRTSLTRNKLVTYDLGMGGIYYAVNHWKGIDTTRIGIIGHGFGGGAAPALMRRLRGHKWGESGAFMYIMSPWYLFSIEKHGMENYPAGVNLVVQIFENDRLNDPRIAADIFNVIGIPAKNKCFLMTQGLVAGSLRVRADFSTPFGDRPPFESLDRLDTLAVWNGIDASIRATFQSDSLSFRASVVKAADASNRALPAGHAVLTEVDTSSKKRPEGIWVNQWNSPRNPRLDANIIRKSRKTYFRHKAKKIKQVSRYLAKKAKAGITSSADTLTDTIQNPIDSGFGADGPYSIICRRFPSPRNTKDTVSFFVPDPAAHPLPVILFLHGYNNGKTEYFYHLIDHIVSNGYALIFSPYPTFPTVDDEKTVMDKYEIAYHGFNEAVKRYSEYIDTSRIGIFGQSFGAGAVPWVAHEVLTKKGWGKNGAFLFMSAPWYPFGVSTENLKALPETLKLLVVTYADDVFNDHLTAIDLYKTIGVPESEKCYVTMYSDTLEDLILPANHFVPYSDQNVNGVIDNFDFYGIFRLFDALAAYTFTGDVQAKKIALGKGAPEQCFMGEWPDGSPVTPFSVSSNPKPLYSTLRYMFSWNNRLNPRRESITFPWQKKMKTASDSVSGKKTEK
jgi:acetyl esterase/lipase